MINNAGKVMFHDALGGAGTELEVVISYHPPAGELGAGVAKLLNPLYEKVVRQDVMNFKEYIETKHNNSAATTSSSVANQPAIGGQNTATGQLAGNSENGNL